MAMNPKSPVKQRFAKPETALAPIAVAKAVPAFEPAPAPVAQKMVAKETSADATALSLKALDLWSENASAFFDFAKELGEAKTFGDLVETQSRFASARYDAFMRQSGDFTQLAQRCALEAGRSAPTGFFAA
jgi:hypothetical protein